MAKCRYRKHKTIGKGEEFKDCIREECEHYLEFPMEFKDSEGIATIKTVGKCVDWWNAKLKMEGNKISIGQQQAIESFRNEMVKIEDRKTQYMLSTGGIQRLIEGG